MKKICSTGLLLFAAAGALFSQTGRIEFNVLPENAILKVNGQTVSNHKEAEVPAGTCIIQAWAPEKKLYTDTVTIQEGQLFRYHKYLLPTPEFRRYNRDVAWYQFDTGLYYTLKYGSFLVPVLYASSAFPALVEKSNTAETYRQLALEQKKLYEESDTPEDIDNHRKLFHVYNREYRTAYDRSIHRSKNLVKPAIITGSMLAGALACFVLLKRPKRPVYTEIPKLTALEYTIDYQYDTFALKLSYPF
jgi:hypothetical protein